MRTWILGSAYLITETISPGAIWGITLSAAVILLGITGAIMDISEYYLKG